MLTEIAQDLYCLGPHGRTQTNVYLVRSGSACALVDAGWASDGPRIQDAAVHLIGPEAAPAAILLTHHHPDHGGAARQLAEAWECPVFVHPREMPIALGDFAAMKRFAGPLDRWVVLPLMRAMGRRRREAAIARSSLTGPARALDPTGQAPALPGWEWVATPGHSPGHVSYFRREDRVLLSGDALVTLRVNSPAGWLVGANDAPSGPPRYTSWDWSTARESIQALASLEPAVVAGGHGRPLAGAGTAPSLRAFAEHMGGRPGHDDDRTS